MFLEQLSGELRLIITLSLLKRPNFPLILVDHPFLLIQHLLHTNPASMYNLRIKRPNLLLEHFLLFPFLKKLITPLLQCLHNIPLILLNLFLLLLQLHQLRLVNKNFVPFLQLATELLQLDLVLADERLLVQVLVDGRLVADVLCAMREF